MKFETMFRRLLDAAYIAYNHQSGGSIETAMHQAREGIMEENKPSLPLDLRFSEVIERAEGPIVTACLFRNPQTSFRFFQGLHAAGLIRLRSNHRVIVTRGNLLGEPDKDHFEIIFAEGDSQITDDVQVLGGHRTVPPFLLGDLSATDQALHYMMSRAVLGDRAEIKKIGQHSFPPINAARSHLCCEWPTDVELFRALLQPQAA